MSDIRDIEDLPSTPPYISEKAENAIQNNLPQKSMTSTSGPNKPRNPRPKKEEPSKEAIEAKLKLLRQEKQLVKEEKKLVDQLEKAKSLENKKPVRQPRPNNNAAKNTTTGNKPNVKKEINVQIRKVETVKVQKKTTQK